MEKKPKILISAVSFFIISLCMIFYAESTSEATPLLPQMVYGEMWNYTGDDETKFITIPILVSETYYNITCFECNDTFGITCNNNHSLIVDYDGMYRIDWTISLTGGINGAYGMGVALNGNIEKSRGCYAMRQVTSGIGNVGGTCILPMRKGDYVVMQIDDETNPAAAAFFNQANFNMIRIGGLR